MMTCLWVLWKETPRQQFCGRPAQVTTIVPGNYSGVAYWRERLGFLPFMRLMFFGKMMQVCYCPRHQREMLRRLGDRSMLVGERFKEDSLE